MSSHNISKKGVFLTLAFLFSGFLYSQTAVGTTKASALYKKGDSLLLHNKFANSVINFQKALTVYKDSNEWEKVANCYNKISEAQWSNVQLSKALQTANKALEISRQRLRPKNLQEAKALDNIGISHRLNGKDLQEVIGYYKKALDIKTSILKENDLEFSNSYFNLGSVYGVKGEYEKSLDNYNKALNIRKEHLGNEHIKVADVYENIGKILYEVGNYDESLKYFENAFEIANKTLDQNDFYFVKMYNKIGIIYYYKKAFNKCLNYYKRALQISIHNLGEDHPDQARLNHNVGIVYFQLGEKEKALYYIEKTIEIGVKTYGEGYRDLFFPYNMMGQIHGGEKGIYYIKKALDICLKNVGINHVRTAEVYASLGKLYRDVGAYDLSYEFLNKSLEIHIKIFGNRNANIVSSYNLLSDLFLKQNSYEESLKYSEKAIESNNQNLNESVLTQSEFDDCLSPTKLLTSLERKAYALQKKYLEAKDVKILDESIKTYDKAKRLIEVLRRSYSTEDKVTFAKDSKKVYSGAITTKMLKCKNDLNQQCVEAAFYIAENSKSNILKELLNDEKAKVYSGLPDELLELEKELRKELSGAKSNLINNKDSGNRKSLEAEVLLISRRQDSLIKILEEKYPKYYQLKFENQPLAVSKIQDNLSVSTTFVEYFQSDDVLYAFVITKNKISLKKLLVNRLSEEVASFRESILLKNTRDFKNLGFELYKTLIEPIKDDFVGNNLIIVPDESLWHLNFDLLLTSDPKTEDTSKLPYLIKDFAVSYANSAGLLFNGADKKRPMGSEVRKECLAFSFANEDSLAVGDQMNFEVLRNAHEDLPGTRREIKKIASIVKGRYFFGSQAIEQNFKNNLANYNVLHLALHGEVDHQNPENSRIYFTKTKDSIEDNILYSHELYALNIPAELAVLSACNTGMGKIAKGEGVLSLGTAFQYAGTKSLLLTGWEVSDKTTPEVMQNFYGNLNKGMNKAEALQKAKLKYLETADVFTQDPFYWGAFYLIGDYTAIEFEKSLDMSWILYMLIACIGLGIFLYFKRKSVR
ncbi:CHAT domain-containing tetratricopeptide repeat protein [Aquimarina sp. MMG016]|uniref:CHAT domain-containing protein n=1 Tax=Aquimarina sp. MMG016 TaxID=2822690 RepID=UPI001B3A5D84|nr:CHAT domain-containing tetratricopeptide repeat protein [Aquimarina sp. MMG016]MBQ4818911.1 CHAT domain-containing protein [Aquimarina sp. MMG016]